MQLTGEVGTGKTTVCRALLDQLPPEVDVAMIFNPRLTSVELIATICDELRVAYPGGTTSLKTLVDALSRALLDAHARGRRTVLIIDEAQNLSMEVLEELRLLTNLETTRQKLLQVILIGQPELARLLRRPQLRQLAQRVTARYHLEPFTLEESRAYVRHRMTVAGQRQPIFTRAAVRLAHERAAGVPRLVNSVCDRALLGAFAAGEHRVTAATVRRAAAEVLGAGPRRWRLPAAAAAAGVLAVTAAVTAFGTAPLSRIAATFASSAPPAAPADPPPSPVHVATIAPAPGPDAPAARESLAAVLAGAADAADLGRAFTSLYAQWGVPYRSRPGDLACEHGRQAGLRCLFRTGTWNVLRRLDLPAILTLRMPAGDKRFVVVSALAADTATLLIGERAVTVPVRDVEPFWDGALVALWQAPALGAPQLAPGMAGRDIAWLRQRLGEVDGVPAGAGARAVYDEELRRRVVTFQQANGLTPDGIVGEETLVRLVTGLPGSRAPLLSRPGS